MNVSLSKIFRFVIYAVFLVSVSNNRLLAIDAATLDYSSLSETKVVLEKNLEERLRAAISKIVGSDNIVVTVNVYPSTEKSEIERETIDIKPSERTRNTPVTKKRQRNIMPGVPKKNSDVSQEEETTVETEVPFEGTQETTKERIVKLPPFVRKLEATILLEDELSAGTVETVRQTAMQLLGYDIARGDILNIQKIRFPKPKPIPVATTEAAPTPPPPPPAPITKLAESTTTTPPAPLTSLASAAPIEEKVTLPDWKSWEFWAPLVRQYGFYLILTFLAVLFLFGPVTSILTRFLQILNSMAEKPGAEGGKTKEMLERTETIEKEGAPGTQGGTPVSPGSIENLEVTADKVQISEKEPPFTFIREPHLKKLYYLLESEPVDKIALVAGYLNPELVNHFVSYFPYNRQSEIIQEIAKVKQVSPDELKQIEEKIKKSIDFVVGGEEMLLPILDSADSRIQEEIIASLSKRNPELAAKMRKFVIRFDEIVNFDVRIVQTILREVNLSSLAIALRGTTEEVKEKFLSIMPEGTAEMVRQEIELGGIIPQQRIEHEQRRIIEIIRRLEREGKISLEGQRSATAT